MMNWCMCLGQKWTAIAASWAVLMAMTVSAQAQNNVQQALDAAPAGSEFIIIVPNMEGLSQKLASFNDAAGLSVPWLANALSEAKRSAGMLHGVNDQGAAVLVFTDINAFIETDADEEEPEPPFLLLMPVSDFKAFAGNFTIHEPGQGVTPITMADGEKGFLREAGSFAVIGPSEQHVKAYSAGQTSARLIARAGKAGLRIMDQSDALIVVDMASMAPKLLPKIQEGLRDAAQDLENDPDAAANQLVNPAAFLKMYEGAIQSVFTSMDLVVFGLDLSDLGVGLSDAATFKPDSSLAKLIQPATTTAALRLESAANQPYLLAVAYNADHFKLDGLMESLLDTARQSSPRLATLIEGFSPLLTQARGTSSVYYPGQLNLTSGLFNSVGIVATDDPEAYMQAFQKYLATLSETVLPVGTAEKPEEIRFHTRYSPGITTVDGVSIDQYEVRYDLPPSVLANLNPQLMMLAGVSGQRGYVANVNGQIIYTGTPDLPTLSQAIAAIKAGKGLSSNQGIMQVRQQLTPDAAVEAYFDLGTAASTVLNMATAFGYPLDIQVPANLPPIGYSLSVVDDSLTARTFIPLPVIRFTKDVTMTLMPLFGGMGDDGQDAGQDNGRSSPPQSGGGAPPPPR